MRISDLLPTTQNEAISYDQIGRLTGLSARQIREAIRYERRQGIPILTSHEHGASGVWLWSGMNRSELDRCCRMLEHTGTDILETARRMKGGVNGGTGLG